MKNEGSSGEHSQILEYSKTQTFINAAITLAYEMSMIKTIKGHGAQHHMVGQIRLVYGELPGFDEQRAERIRYHSSSFEMRHRNLDE